MKWYPIKFKPIPKQKIWGGDKLKTLLKKPFFKSNIGESWEISNVEGDISIVANGQYKNESLTSLIKTYKAALVGEEIYNQFGDQFPLLIKFIDANQDLSVQLHPNDQLAQKRHLSFGKTEMWYIMESDAAARLVLGFKENIDAVGYIKKLAQNTLPQILNEVPISKGDAFFIPTGTVHAIGAGTVLAEIQQTSDITYRVFDWNRLDSQGNARELHQKLALDAINFNFRGEQAQYSSNINVPNEMVSCNYFTTSYLPIKGLLPVNLNDRASFTIYMCVAGQVKIKGIGFMEFLNYGETVLIPAELKKFTLEAENAKLLEIFI
jgi:mannose-6-phosphate isomerase